jgi:hypothetical protein
LLTFASSLENEIFLWCYLNDLEREGERERERETKRRILTPLEISNLLEKFSNLKSYLL